ncbi:MAG: DUF2318 domain-containing protein [bacterium]|nr:DUF2318 domain-containing protein [bacterium]
MSKTSLIILTLVVVIGGGLAIKLLRSTDQKAITQQGKEEVLSGSTSGIKFLGDKGENVSLENREIKLDSSLLADNRARFYNVKMPQGKTIYFFVVKDKNGVYRAAANACAVCFKTYKGFRQEGNEIVCNNCGNRYPIERIATEKGGCNPGPINPNLEVKNGQIIITQSDLEKVLNLF